MKFAISLILLFSFFAASAAAQMPEYKGSYRDLAAGKKAPPMPPLAAADSSHSYDVLAYIFNLSLNNSSVSGNVDIRFKSKQANLSQIDLHFVGMTVDSVNQEGLHITSSRVGEVLYANLLGPLPINDSSDVKVFYHGTPSAGMFFATNYYGQPMWYTSTEPSDARYWFPCWDEPWDKAYSDMTVDAPNPMIVTGNGLLIGSWDGPGAARKTWHWVENYPIATYLISLAACDYAVLRDSVLVAGSYLPLTDYVYHGDSSAAVYDFANTGAMIQFYSETFGTYPFMGEKYSMSAADIFSGWGAMENMTNTTFGDALITGGRYYEWIVAHELSHMWYGDKTTCLDWRNIWLNEGFATYLDALFTEHFYGESEFLDRLAGFRSQYFSEDSHARYPIYDPPPAYLFGSAEYEKGGCVLHMLRGVVTDSVFFAGMRVYSDSFAYANASTEDFERVMESFHGDSLDWFFDEWIYDQGYPNYTFAWDTQEYNGQVNVLWEVRQVQTNAPLFRMPIRFRFQDPGFDTSFVLWNWKADQYYSHFFPTGPTTVTFDSGDLVILKTVAGDRYNYKPDIVLDDAPIADSLAAGDSAVFIRTIGNAGKSALNFSVTTGIPHGVTVEPQSGSLLPGVIDSLLITLGDSVPIDAAGSIVVTSNDPNDPSLSIPVIVKISGFSVVLPGDANSSGEVNGIDVGFLVNYLKGIGPTPDPYLNADCNGSCTVNGIDVTFLVNYLKGQGPAPFAGECRS